MYRSIAVYPYMVVGRVLLPYMVLSLLSFVMMVLYAYSINRRPSEAGACQIRGTGTRHNRPTTRYNGRQWVLVHGACTGMHLNPGLLT